MIQNICDPVSEIKANVLKSKLWDNKPQSLISNINFIMISVLDIPGEKQVHFHNVLSVLFSHKFCIFILNIIL